MFLSGCSSSSFVLDQSGTLFAFGANTSGKLGVGHSKRVKTPTIVEWSEGVQMIACSDTFSLLLDDSGMVWASGNCPTLPKRTSTFQQLESVGRAIKLCVNEKHWYVLDCAGNVHSSSKTCVKMFQSIPEIRTMSCNSSIVAVQDVNEDLWFWRIPDAQSALDQDQLKPTNVKAENGGLGPLRAILLPERHFFFVTNNGDLFEYDIDDNALKKSDDVPPFTRAVFSKNHFLALAHSGIPCGWGMNSYGQLGYISRSIDFLYPTRGRQFNENTEIAAGLNHSMVYDGCTMYACGNNEAGQLGLPYSRDLDEEYNGFQPHPELKPRREAQRLMKSANK